ncbi:unnamed protein product [Lampetra fluviatilis]
MHAPGFDKSWRRGESDVRALGTTEVEAQQHQQQQQQHQQQHQQQYNQQQRNQQQQHQQHQHNSRTSVACIIRLGDASGPPLIHPIERRVPSSTGSVVVVVAIVITIIARRTTSQRPCDVDAASVNRELRL